MSRFHEQAVSCPLCGKKSTELIATSLRISSETPFKEQILNGNFQRFTCEDCNHPFYVEDPLMYIDFGKKIMIAQFPKSWNGRWQEHEQVVKHNFDNYLAGKYAAPSARKMSEGFQLRTVFGLDALAEKVSCLEFGLDDQLLSILKLQLILNVEEIPFHPEFIPLLKEIRDEELVFLCRVLNPERKIENEILTLPYPDALNEVKNSVDQYTALLETFHEATYIDIGRMFFSSDAEAV